MPYHIEDDNSDCSGYAVVKDDDDEIMGCHDTRGEAEDQLDALYASEAKSLLPWGETVADVKLPVTAPLKRADVPAPVSWSRLEQLHSTED